MNYDEFYTGASYNTTSGELTLTRVNGATVTHTVVTEGNWRTTDSTDLSFVENKPTIGINSSTIPLSFKTQGAGFRLSSSWLSRGSGSSGTLAADVWLAGTYQSKDVVSKEGVTYRNNNAGPTTQIPGAGADWVVVNLENIFCEGF